MGNGFNLTPHLGGTVRNKIVLLGSTNPISGEEMQRESLIVGTGFCTKEKRGEKEQKKKIG